MSWPDNNKLHWFEAEQVARALGVIFWGTLLHVFDLSFSSTSNGGGFRFDILNDAVAAFMIAWGVTELRGRVPDDRYGRILSFLQIVAYVAVLDAIRLHLIVDWPPPLEFLFAAFNLVELVAVYLFCTAMLILCQSYWLVEVEPSWSLSQRLYFWLNLLPAGLLQLLGILVILVGPSGGIHFENPLVIVFVIAMVIPLIHILISISRTRRRLRYGPPPTGLPV